MPRFVLEIGTEELPPRYFPPALSQLHDGAVDRLAKARLAHGEVKVYGTPRRLALVVEEMAAVQAPAIREERGPSAKVAFDAEGKPTKAATGFARRHGIAPEDLVRRQTDQGEYVFAVIREPEAPAKDALAALLPDLITGLSFPKSMRWGAGTIRFGRPIRWLLALIDDQVVEFSVGEVHSGRKARGHPVLADGMFEVKHAKDYERALEGRFVLVRAQERLDRIRAELRRLREQEGATTLKSGTVWDYTKEEPLDHIAVQRPAVFEMEMTFGLLVPTVYLVEYPTVRLGRFDPSFARLPRPILEAEMVDVQSFFPVAMPRREGEELELLPRFIAVRDGGADHLDAVIAGWESVLRAKLIDASYFYEQDQKRALADRIEDLKDLVFQEKLGSMYAKMERVCAIAEALAAALKLSEEEKRLLGRAAQLCKADLTTQVVADMTKLQGVIGGEYARRIEPAEPEEVCSAIRDHYRPASARDEVPYTALGRCLALADKIDTITAYFSVGSIPTGSADPYGLRREGTGVVKIICDPDPQDQRFRESVQAGLASLSLAPLIDVALGKLPSDTQRRDEIAAAIMGFLRQRLVAYLESEPWVGGRGVRYDLVSAALAVGFDKPGEAVRRAEVLKRYWDAAPPATGRTIFMNAVIAGTRVANITRGFDGAEIPVDPAPLDAGAEQELRDAYDAVERYLSKWRSDQAEQDLSSYYNQLLEQLSTLRADIDKFFNDVLVMAEDEKVRNNRLALCWQVNQLFRQLADFTVVVQA